MDSGLPFALASLLCAGVNDLVFKKQATSGQGRGQYIAIVGMVWAVTFAAAAVFAGHRQVTAAAVKWGLLAGVAVLLFAEKPRSGDVSAARTRALVLVIFASVLRAGMGISYKLAAAEFARLEIQGATPQHHWFLALQGLMWGGMGLAVAWRFEGATRLSRLNVGYGVFSGALVCGIVLFLARALAVGDASVIIPITQMSFLVTALLSWPVTRERFSGRKVSALALAAAAILLLSLAL